MPFLLYSVARQVGRLCLSNISTPLRISSTIVVFVSSKRSIFSFHLNGVVGCSRLRNGCILSAYANAYATWFTSPKQLRTSVMVRGLGNPLLASMTCGRGRIVVGVISNPVKVVVSLAKENFEGLGMMPFRPYKSSQKGHNSLEFDFFKISKIISKYYLSILYLT